MEGYAALILSHACKDAVCVFPGLLDILAAAGDIQFPGFEEITWLILIGYGYRQDRYFKEILDKITISTHIQHFKHALTSLVMSVLGTSTPLRDPYRATPRSYILPHIGREKRRSDIFFPGRTASDNLNHAV